jgi:hypothetical protein
LVLDEKPVEKHGSEVTYRSVVTFASTLMPPSVPYLKSLNV